VTVATPGDDRHILRARGDLDLTFLQKLRPILPWIGYGALAVFVVLDAVLTDWALPPGPASSWMAHLLGLSCMAIAPGMAIGLYVYYRDYFYDESWKRIGRIFLWGFLLTSVAPFTNHLGGALLGYSPDSSSLAGHFVFFFFVVGMGEEAIKFVVPWKLVYRSPDFKQVYDGIVFCSSSALAFAVNENIAYVLTSGAQASYVAFLRALTAVPLHMATGVVMGYGMGRAREAKGSPREREYLALGFGGAVLIHGAYDFFLMVPSAARLLFLVTLVGGWVFALKVIKKGMACSPFAHCEACKRVVPRLAAYCPYCRDERRVELECQSCEASISKWTRRCTECNARVRFPWHLQIRRMRDFFPRHRFAPCPSCTEEIPSGTGFCLHCGQRLEWPRVTPTD